jgi:hypothetical protein
VSRTKQEDRQRWFRDQITTAGTYNNDIMACAKTLTATTPVDCNEAHVILINHLLSTSYTKIEEALNAIAIDRSVDGWDQIGYDDLDNYIGTPE